MGKFLLPYRRWASKELEKHNIGDVCLNLFDTEDPVVISYRMTSLFQIIYLRYLEQNPTCVYTEVLDNSGITELCGILLDMLTRSSPISREDVWSNLQLSCVVHYHVSSYEVFGKRTYMVDPTLAEKLRSTELRGVLSDDMRLPYESIYIDVPESAGLRVHNNLSGWHACTGLYLCEDPNIQRGGLSTLPVAWWKQAAPLRGWRIMVVGEDKKEILDHGDDAILYFRIPLPEGERLDDILTASIKDFRHVSLAQNPKHDPNMAEVWGEIFHWALNLILYITHVEPGERWMLNDEARSLWARIQKLPKNSKKREKLKQKFKGMDPRNRIILGKPTLIKRSGSTVDGKGRPGPRSVPEVQTRVSGHWRRVAHGKNRAERSWRWIEPYWKFKYAEKKRENGQHEVR